MLVVNYTIISGDTLSLVSTNLAKCKGVTYQEIASFNGINPNDIYVGEVLKIPNTHNQDTNFRYTVRSGDTLGKIASGIDEAAGITVDDILNANPQVEPADLKIGQVLAFPSSTPKNSTVGFWMPTWPEVKPKQPLEATSVALFSGWPDPSKAVADSKPCMHLAHGALLISLGGGNENGRWTQDDIDAVLAALNNKLFIGYQGIMFDIEVGDSGLENGFQQVFALAKTYKYQVLVSVSHTAPYAITDNLKLMQSILADENVDVISPQLYSGGRVSKNDYTPTPGVPWSTYQGCKPNFAKHSKRGLV